MEIKKTDSKPEVSNLIYIKIFILVVVLLFVGSLALKGFMMFKARQYTSYSFNTLFVGKNSYLLYVNSHMNILSMARIKNAQHLSDSDRVKNSLILGIPIRSIIKTDIPENLSASELLSFAKTMQLVTGNTKARLSGLNKIDIMYMYLVSKGAPNTNINTYTIDMKNVSDVVDTKLYNFFKDEDVINEKVSIDVVNTTDVSGLGSQFSKMLKTVGFNVVSVTSDSEVEHSQVVSRVDKDDVTYRALESFLAFPTVFKDEASIADITIILGNDIKKNL